MTFMSGLPPVGRRFTIRRSLGLGDVGIDGRLRVDALARYLQDAASADADDAGVRTTWVVRRTTVAPTQWPQLPERLEITTWCAGYGARWAERRTQVLGDRGSRVDASALWVCVDGAGRPAALDDQFFACYAEAAGGRRVKARLTHAPPGHSAASRPWALRHSDLDVLGHVNNAASWEAVVDEVARCFPGRVVARAEVEHVGPVEVGDDVVLVRELGEGGLRMWLCVGGAVRVSATVSTVPVQESKGPGSAAQL